MALYESKTLHVSHANVAFIEAIKNEAKRKNTSFSAYLIELAKAGHKKRAAAK